IKYKNMAARFPEAELIVREFCIRQLSLPELKTKKAMLRWFALATGLISRNETRSKILTTLEAVFLLLKKKAFTNEKELQRFIKEKFSVRISQRLLNYHLQKIEGIGLIARKRNRIEIAPSMQEKSFANAFEENFIADAKRAMESIKKRLEELEERYV
ncbi:MAG: hypothetical protein J7L14_03380, partial [Candidatus Diapherotrites archaeon]|nr:hypothetical protein [Candidatus Diapherotrites archaeon]